MIFKVWIPLLPPSSNMTYQITSRSGKAVMYKSEEANNWAASAALIIGAEAGDMGWEDDSDFYILEVLFSKLRGDVDGPCKLTQDVLATKLGFNDNRIKKQSSEKVDLGDPGVWIVLEPYKEKVDVREAKS